MAHKCENMGVQPEIPEDKQGSNKYVPKIEDRLETRPQAGPNKELQRLDDWWLKHSQEQEQELQRKSVEIQNLTVGSPVMISMLFSNFFIVRSYERKSRKGESREAHWDP